MWGCHFSELTEYEGIMGVQEHQLTSDSHHENILTSLHQLRIQGQLCDVTVQVDHHGDVQEFQAHQVILAASSGYFKNVLLSQDAAKDKLLLSNMQSNDFAKFLEFVYTGTVEVAEDKIGDFQAVAQLLDCESLSVVCGEALRGGVLQKPGEKTRASELKSQDASGSTEKGRKTKGKKQPKSSLLKRQLSPTSSEKEEVIRKKLKVKNIQKNARARGKKLKLKLAGCKVLRRRWYYTSNENLHSKKQVGEGGTEECENGTEDEAQPENKRDKTEETSPAAPSSDQDEWECEDEVHSIDPRDPLFLLEAGNEEEEGQFKRKRKKTSKAQFQCSKCMRTFHYERSYLKHINTYHGVKADVIYRCEICQQTFANRSNLKIHEKHVHSNERLFECEACAKTFKRKKDVVRHKRQVHERNLQHMCPDCGKTLSSKAALLLHERTHTGTKPYECTQCKARFSQNSALKTHQRIHTGEKPFACDECDARFTQKHMLAYHKRSHTGEKPFMCEACGKSFASKEYLKHHSNIHTGSKPFKCDKCGRGFAQRNSLNQHLKIHTGERPYKCKDCDKQFTQINALQRHQRIHTGEKPYMCVLCKRTFSDMSTLRRHTLVHDTEAPWKTYLVVLEGNIEEKKPRSPTEKNAEKTEPVEKNGSTSDIPNVAGATAAVSAPATSSATGAGTTQCETTVVPTESVTLPSDWTSHGAIALVSHGALGGITVIHTEVPAGAQIQPIVAASSTGTSVISLDGSAISVPFSIPVSVSQPVSVSSEASSSSLSLPTLSVPVSDTLLASVSDISTVSTPSVLEADASQVTLASPLENKSNTDPLPPDIQTVVVGNEPAGEQTNDAESDGQRETADNPLVEPKPPTVQDTD